MAASPPTTLDGLTDSDVITGPAAPEVTVKGAVRLTLPSVAVSDTGVSLDTVEPVTVKVWLVAPVATVTVAGTPAAALEAESVTVVPPVGAAWLRVTVPVAVPPLAMVAGVTVNPVRPIGVAGATTVSGAV